MTSCLSVVGLAPLVDEVRSRCSTSCYGFLMAEQISQRELRNDSGRIMRALDDGASFVVTRNGTPVGELRPLRRHRFVPASTAVAMFRSAPAVDSAAFRSDLDEVVDQEIPHRA
jgi:antitoxin (DNA-binding transcriptional repressor) of toxin-antitoxin stability system